MQSTHISLRAKLLRLLEGLLGGLLSTFLGTLLTESDKTSIIPGCLELASDTGRSLLSRDLTSLLRSLGLDVRHGLLASGLLSNTSLLSSSIILPALLELLSIAREDNEVSLVLAETLHVGLFALHRAVATTVIDSDAQ